jgi:ketosteroid isomerase-like protein
MSDQQTRDETRIRERIDAWATALRAKDVAGVMAHYTRDVSSFDLAPPLQHRWEALKRGLEEWFPTFEGPIGYEIRDLNIAVGDALAFSTSLNRITGRRTDGQTTDVWVRATVCFRKVAGAWMVAHEHTSVPFYMDGSFRAAVDLKP